MATASIYIAPQLGVCIPFAGHTTTKANNFAVKPRTDGSSGPGPTKLKRSDFSWWVNQPNRAAGVTAGQNDDVSQFTDIFLMLDAAAANGYKLIGMCGYTPPWAQRASRTDKDYPADNRDYANYVYLVGRECENRQPGVLIMREIWNEPNQLPFMIVQDVNQYIAMLQVAYDSGYSGVIEGRTDNGSRTVVAQTCQIMTAGTGAAPSITSPYRHAAWTNAIIAAAPNSFDHVGIHAYSGSDDALGTPHPGTQEYDPGVWDLPRISNALANANRYDAQIISTEGGWKIPGVTTVDNAAQWLDDSWAWWKAHAGSRDHGGTNYGLGPFLVFECDDTSSNSSALDDRQGFYTYGTSIGDGVSKKNGSGVPTYLNKYVSLAPDLPTGPNNPPTGSIVFPANNATIQGKTSILFLCHDDKTPAPNLAVKGFQNPSGANVNLGRAQFYNLESTFGWNHKLDIDTTDGTWPDGTYTIGGTVNDTVNGPVTITPITVVVNNNGTTGPHVTGVSLSTIDPAGGQTVTVTGDGFTGISGAHAVQLVNGPQWVVDATSYAFVDDHHITFVTPPQPTTQGLNFPLYLSTGAGRITHANIDAMVAAGAIGCRTSLDWNTGDSGFAGSTYTGAGHYDQTSYMDDLLAYAATKTCLNGQVGFEICLQIALGNFFEGHGFNHNANADASPGNAGPVNVPKLLSNFAVEVATHHASAPSLKYIELGNEPNDDHFDVPIQAADGTYDPAGTVCSGVAASNKGNAWFEYSARCYPAISALGTVKTLTAGVGGFTDTDTTQAGDTFVAQMYAANFIVGGHTYHGTDGLFDHLAFHPYFAATDHDTATADLALWPHFTARNWARMCHGGTEGGVTYAGGNDPAPSSIAGIMAAHGHLATKGIVITEVGQPTNQQYNATDAASALADCVLNQWNLYTWGGAGGNFMSLFQATDQGAKGKDFGIYLSDWVTAKQPYWQQFHDLGIQCHAPQGQPPITFDVIVKVSGNKSPASSADQVTYGSVSGTGPVVGSCVATSTGGPHGPATAGTAVTLNGSGFTGATGVKLGGVACTSVSVVSDIKITLATPAGTAGTTKNFKVTTPLGTSTATAGSRYAFDVAQDPLAPTITSISPATGPAGTTVTVNGTNFTNVSSVLFNGVAALRFTIVNSGKLTADAPAGSGHGDIIVTNDHGPNTGSSADIFTWTTGPGIPTVSSASPATGPQVGGADITVLGTNFVNVTDVQIGGVSCTKITVASATKLTCRTAGGVPKGSYDLIVTNSSGPSQSPSPVQYAYGNNPPVVDITAIVLSDKHTVVTPPHGTVSGTIQFLIYGVDDSDSTFPVWLLEGATHQHILRQATVTSYGYAVSYDTRLLSDGVHTFWASGGPDSGNATGLSAGYPLTIKNGTHGGPPPPKR